VIVGKFSIFSLAFVRELLYVCHVAKEKYATEGRHEKCSGSAIELFYPSVAATHRFLKGFFQ
jgi:hypothetical protein